MILGIGTDLCDIRRIEASLARFGDRLRFRAFTELERGRALKRGGREANSLAMSFAAKEACSKALGTGFRRGVALIYNRCGPFAKWQTDLGTVARSGFTLDGIDASGHETHTRCQFNR